MKKPYVTDKEFMHEFIKDKEAVRSLLGRTIFVEPEVSCEIIKDLVEAYGGVSALAKDTGLSRVAIYTMISPKGNPSLSSLRKVVHAMGLKAVV
jgi:probable addiction module antidote protein